METETLEYSTTGVTCRIRSEKRIRPEWVKSIYDRAGCEPDFDGVIESDAVRITKAMPLVAAVSIKAGKLAILSAVGHRDPDSAAANLAGFLGLTAEYAAGFWQGWFEMGGPLSSTDRTQGFIDGLKCRLRIRLGR